MYLCKGGNGKGKDAEAVIKLSGKRTKVQLLRDIHTGDSIHGSEERGSTVAEWNENYIIKGWVPLLLNNF